MMHVATNHIERARCVPFEPCSQDAIKALPGVWVVCITASEARVLSRTFADLSGRFLGTTNTCGERPWWWLEPEAGMQLGVYGKPTGHCPLVEEQLARLIGPLLNLSKAAGRLDQLVAVAHPDTRNCLSHYLNFATRAGIIAELNLPEDDSPAGLQNWLSVQLPAIFPADSCFPLDLPPSPANAPAA